MRLDPCYKMREIPDFIFSVGLFILCQKGNTLITYSDGIFLCIEFNRYLCLKSYMFVLRTFILKKEINDQNQLVIHFNYFLITKLKIMLDNLIFIFFYV